ncbi:MAG: carboxypeptidase-like regulatory domain-containing protein [Planctomycetaceae bacterium]|jgi:hypothetical protein|nr:carboxypeptidase-like regulatory domain-containing protein [Planctomycetaceae bacterium]
MKHFIIFTLLLLSAAGCSQRVKVHGTVTFPDGEPVAFGQVCFVSPAFTFTGKLDANGHYAAGDTRDGAGIPVGEYQVYLANTALIKKIGAKDGTENYTLDETERVDDKFTSPQTSGFVFSSIRGGNKTFDFTVERPKEAGSGQ